MSNIIKFQQTRAGYNFAFELRWLYILCISTVAINAFTTSIHHICRPARAPKDTLSLILLIAIGMNSTLCVPNANALPQLNGHLY